MPTLNQYRESILPPDEPSRLLARARLDTLTKPLGSLGQLEDFAAQILAIREHSAPLNKAVYVFAADHGVTAEGVSAYPSAVTEQMVLNFLAEGAAINVLARLHNAALHVIDVGVDADLNTPNLIQSKVRRASRNMRREPALSPEELDQALAAGFRMAEHAHSEGRTLVAAGEMGIGNTTSASAITALLTGLPPATVTGLGTGISASTLAHKTRIIEETLALHFGTPKTPPPAREILRCVGGLEIAAITGFVLAAAHHRMVIVCDGFIATAAAALAVGIAPNVSGYLIAGHRSQEPGHRALLHHLHLEPVLQLNMRLGEGTGAVLAMPILDSALALYREMATFTSAGVSQAETTGATT